MKRSLILLLSVALIAGMLSPAYAQTTDPVSVTVSSDKSSYLFDDTAIIQGTVSKKMYVEKPYFQTEPLLITIVGSNYHQSVSLYPDFNLNYEITLRLVQVLGINEGSYDVSVSYAGVTADTSFSVGHEIIVNEIEEDRTISIDTDKSQYLPGSNVRISAVSDFISPLEGLYFEVVDPNQQVIFSGNLFPINGVFSTTIFLNTINPSYGTYQIIGNYSDETATTLFELVEDIKEDKLISIWTDKEVYGLGETVSISGRLNDFWIPSLNLEIIQMRNLSLGDSGGFANKILDVVSLDSDGSFTSSFKIPVESGLGDYVIKISKDIGSATKFFVVSENPKEYTFDNDPFTVFSNEESYSFGDVMILTGKIAKPVTSTTFSTPLVTLKIFDSTGKSFEMIGHNRGEEDPENRKIIVNEKFTTFPDSSGQFNFEIPITRSQFNVSDYDVNLKYGVLSTSLSFSVTDPVDVSEMILTLDKEIYGFNESVILSGLTPALGDPSVVITLTKPDGHTSNFGTTIDNQKFSWSWITPVSEKNSIMKLDGARTAISTNLGIYKINVATASSNYDLFFKVSLTPETDSISDSSLFVNATQSLYKAGDDLHIVGTVLPHSIGRDGVVGTERIYLKVIENSFPYEILSESAVHPKHDGSFQSFFELPVSIFPTGEYTIKAMYYGFVSESIFAVSNDYAFGIDDDVTLLISTDKSQYYLGDTVTVSGKPNKLIYLDKFDVSVIQKSDVEITCGSFICGIHQGPVTSILPSPSGSFEYSFVIDNSNSSLGSYEITVDADFETKSIQFNVVPTPKLNTIIEKQNRISEKEILIFTEEKIIENISVSPRVLSGSLVIPLKGDESNIHLKVSSESGVCIIGQSDGCLVSDSTRKPGQIFDVVEVDGVSLNVRYTGPDVRLEKFSILPESSDEFLPDTNWNVQVIKEDEISRFYYKVTYKTLQ